MRMFSRSWKLPWLSPPPWRSSKSLDLEEEHGMLESQQRERILSPNKDDTSVQRAWVARNVPKAIISLMLFFMPSFFRSHGNTGEQSRNGDASTSALDGLRGYAALAVMNYHLLYAYQPFVFYGYGLSESSAMQFFFVLSGFVLSYKPLVQSRDASSGFTKAVKSMTSCFFRRPVRLYGPPIVASFITMLAIQLGAYEHGRKIAYNPKWVPLLHWLDQSWRMLYVFWWGDLHNRYDVHLWTIPVEFRCSLAIFLILPVYMILRSTIRVFLMIILIVYVYALDRWDVALFFSGLLIADTAIASRTDAMSLNIKKPGRNWPVVAMKVLLLIGSLWLMSAPDFCVMETPGFQLLGWLIPPSDPAPNRFLPNLGGILLVSLLTHTEQNNAAISWFLNSSIPQYLGRISYSLYIVHGPLIHTVGYAVFPFFWTVSGTDEVWRYVIGFISGYLVLLGVVLYVSDIFWRAVDVTFVRLAKAWFSRMVEPT
ncbi:acyltransferase family domain-containing protein [Trichoderma breve]|uniref:Acyltransferase family domain-containing protein n=1 Tax=Trichoderma breve TaxID=2034170 RepID=A0A9W9BHI6_9HYPO|nr:acyltransferase family domain-containing protein [Trichoderma breve]KAJ4860475.1 acyltransferase family domain-containing protein [Trichoderma breve]